MPLNYYESISREFYERQERIERRKKIPICCEREMVRSEPHGFLKCLICNKEIVF